MDLKMLLLFGEMLDERLSEMLPVAAGLRASIEHNQDFGEAVDEVEFIGKKSLGDIASTLYSRTQQHIMEILDALKRLKDGSYGICRKCGDEIEVERLEIQPMVTLCVHCKQRLQLKGLFQVV